jgi:hypothetical protein
MNLHTTSFFNSTEVNISSRMNEYMKKNFGYEVEGDFDTLQEARKSLQAEQLELKDNYMSAKYVENMLMIETITSLLKAHGETLKEDDYRLDRQDGKYDPEEIKQMQQQQNQAAGRDELNKQITSSEKATTIEVDYDLDLENRKNNPLLKKHYKEMKKFNVFISMPEWQEGPSGSGFGAWTAKVRGSKKNLLGWLKAWEYDYDKEQLEDMGLGESVEQMNEANRLERKPLYDLVGDLGAGDRPLAEVDGIFHDLIRFLDGDTIKNFVADFRRNNDLNHPGEDGDYGEDDANFEAIEETAVEEAGEEKGPDHYKWKNDSQLAVALGRIESAMEALDYAIQYRSENSDKFLRGFEERAGVGDLMRIKEKLVDIHSNWEKETEYYGM